MSLTSFLELQIKNNELTHTEHLNFINSFHVLEIYKDKTGPLPQTGHSLSRKKLLEEMA